MNKNALTSILPGFIAVALILTYSMRAHAEQQVESDDNNDVEIVRIGDRPMYRYTDAQGNLVVQDRPPPHYYQVSDTEPEAAVQDSTPALKPATVTAHASTALAQFFVWFLGIAFLAAGFYTLFQPALRRLLAESPLDKCLRQADMLTFADVKLSNGARLQAEADRIVKTPVGLMVLGIEKMSGTISGTTEQEQWRQTGSFDTVMMANPLLRVRHATSMVRDLVEDVPVFGRVIDTGDAKYTNGVPAKIQKLPAFRAGLKNFSGQNITPAKLDAAWRRMMIFPRSNKPPVKLLGTGWQAWLRKHGRDALAGLLFFCSAVTVLAAQIVFQ